MNALIQSRNIATDVPLLRVNLVKRGLSQALANVGGYYYCLTYSVFFLLSGMFYHLFLRHLATHILRREFSDVTENTGGSKRRQEEDLREVVKA